MPQDVTTLIAADNHWALLAILFASAFLTVFLEQRYKWASKVSGAVIILVIAIVLVNLRVIPSEAPVFDDFVWGYAVPMAILLLLRTNLRRMHREAGRFPGHLPDRRAGLRRGPGPECSDPAAVLHDHRAGE